jgi:hypothetical protein
MIRLQVVVVFVFAFLLVGCGAVPPNQTTSNTQPSTTPPGSTDPAPPPAVVPPVPVPPNNARMIADIQKLPTWGSCSSNCAGEPGTDAIYSMEQGIASPSLTGSAIKFNITGGTPWADALWWKQIGGNDAITHFIYEMSYYLNDVPAAQALEFNVNQNAGGWRYEYATQCDIRGAGVWRIWDHSAMHWVATSAPCPVPAANTWNKLSWEFARTDDHKVVWVAVTLNGQRSEINQSFNAFTAAGSGIDVAFQMDSDGGPTPWSVWVDKISLTEW